MARSSFDTETGVMDGMRIALWSLGGIVALSALLRLMALRRNEAVAEWQAKAEAERKNKKPN